MKKKSSSGDEKAGLMYRRGVVGKRFFRVREAHVAEHTAPLIARGAVGAAKLDLMLRAIALLPQHAGRREPGSLLPKVRYEYLHDLCRIESLFSFETPENIDLADPRDLAAKREWVRKQLCALEEMNLVERRPRPGQRPLIVVLRDDGSGEPFDDPNGNAGNSYVTVSGYVCDRWLPVWQGHELAAYLAAMVAGRYAVSRTKTGGDPGDATWFQPLKWFADEDGHRPETHVRIPFSVRSLERGFKALREAGLIEIERTTKRPDKPGAWFEQPRSIYRNRFVLQEALAIASAPGRAVDLTVTGTSD